MKNYHGIVFRKSLRAAFFAAASLPLIVGLTASAQQSSSEGKSETVELEKFTVTGSFLPLTSEVSASPVVILERSKIGLTGATDVLQLLKDAPRSSRATATSVRN